MNQKVAQPFTIQEWLNVQRRKNNYEPIPENIKRIFDTKEALSGAQIIDFIKKHSEGEINPTINILPDLDNMPYPTKTTPIILNLTDDPNKGTHWAVLFAKYNRIYMFDSYQVDLRILPSAWRRVTRRWNTCGFQNPNSVVCGHYTALAVLYPWMFKAGSSLVKCSAIQTKHIRKHFDIKRLDKNKTHIRNDINVFLMYNALK